MLRFRLGRIPVQVHPSHLFVSAFFGLWLFQEQARGGPSASWPGSALGTPGTPGFIATAAAVVALWTGIVFVSVLVHELGHALASRLFGYDASIDLVGLGGHTRPHVTGHIPWHQDVVLTLAGPLAGLALGGVCLLLLRVTGDTGGPLAYALGEARTANVFWAVANLIPVMPLDGGRVAYRLFVRAFGRRGFLFSQLLGLTVAAAVVALALLQHSPVLVLFAVMFGMQTLGYLQAYFRGEGPPGTELAMQAEPALQAAEEHLAGGRLEDAAQQARAVLEDPRTRPPSRGRAHLVLGWVALKEAQGRRALDHFSQVHGVRVPPHALAAAFSLVGDDTKALPVWEMAWQATRNRTVLHEWAGSLIRAGSVDRARRLPGVDLASAYACAARVPFLRGAYSEAAELDERGLEDAPRADLAYDAACAHAQAGALEAAVRMLERAAELGFRDRDYAASDGDLARLHGHPAFATWLSRLGESAAS